MPLFQITSRIEQAGGPPKRGTRHFPSQWYVVARIIGSIAAGGIVITLLLNVGEAFFLLLPALVSFTWAQPQHYKPPQTI